MALVPFCELQHRSHDYRYLVRRWKSVAAAAGLRLKEFARAAKFPIYALETPGAAEDPGCVYISAGIHGDEPGATEGLIHWAERHLARLATRRRNPLSFLILPCLNPWGLTNNRREDAEGRDLNRIFDRQDVAPIGPLRQMLEGRQFSLTINLHEDYDAQGIYLYELARRPPDLGTDLLKTVGEVLPIETRTRIDGRPAVNGLLLRRANLQRIPLHPEAIYLYLRQCDRSLTFETPSEFSIARRVEAHVRMLEFCTAWVTPPARRLSVPRAGNKRLPF